MITVNLTHAQAETVLLILDEDAQRLSSDLEIVQRAGGSARAESALRSALDHVHAIQREVRQAVARDTEVPT